MLLPSPEAQVPGLLEEAVGEGRGRQMCAVPITVFSSFERGGLHPRQLEAPGCFSTLSIDIDG